jgi:hypothetical protein
MSVATVLAWVASNWKAILTLIGIGVASYVAVSVAQTLSQAVAQAQPALTQAIQITAYAIPVIAYSLVMRIVFDTISMIRDIFAR